MVEDMETLEKPSLTALDRCDTCGARAVALVTKDEMELLFCNHHLMKNKDGLDRNGWTVRV